MDKCFDETREELKEKLPVLSAGDKDRILNMSTVLTNPLELVEVMRFGDAVAEAQRDADIEWFLGVCYG